MLPKHRMFGQSLSSLCFLDNYTWTWYGTFPFPWLRQFYWAWYQCVHLKFPSPSWQMDTECPGSMLLEAHSMDVLVNADVVFLNQYFIWQKGRCSSCHHFSLQVPFCWAQVGKHLFWSSCFFLVQLVFRQSWWFYPFLLFIQHSEP